MAADNKKIFRSLAATLVFGWLFASASGCGQGPPGRFVVVVVMDTVRRDALGCYGRAGQATPALDAVAADGVRFDRAFAASGRTLPSVTSLLTSTWPVIHGARWDGETFSRLRPEVATVAEAMRGAGYLTAAFSSNAFVGPPSGLDRGFEVFDHATTLKRRTTGAHETVDAAIAFARDHRGDDCFILLHLSTPGPDYGPFDDDMDRVRDVYRGAVSSIDQQVGRLVDALKSAGVYERGLVVVTSDHGVEFREHGGFGDGHTLHDELVGVPLVIKFPSDVHPAVPAVRWQVGLIDAMPTVLDYLAVETPESFRGESLLSFVRGEPRGHRNVLSEGLFEGATHVAWRTASYAYFQNMEDANDGVGELYNWRNDPGEHDELSGAEPEIAEQMRNECTVFYRGLREQVQGMSPLERIDLSPEED